MIEQCLRRIKYAMQRKVLVLNTSYANQYRPILVNK